MNEMWRWVDRRVECVHLADLQAYLLNHGWKRKPFPQLHTHLYEQTPEGNQEPIVQLLPAAEQARDFRRIVVDTITSLSAVEERHPVDILNEMLRSGAHSRSEGANGDGQSGKKSESASAALPT